MLEAVIGLGAGLFYNSPMEAVVVVLRTNRPADQRGKVLFINAVNLVARERAQSFLRASDQQTILDAYQDYTDKPGLSAAVDEEVIAGNGSSLNIALYVRPGDGEDKSDAVSVEEAVAQWRAAAAAADEAVGDVLAALRAEVASDVPGELRKEVDV